MIVSAGYMRVLGPPVVDGGGIGGSTSIRRCCRRSRACTRVRDALAYGVKVTGVTVHLVDEGVDTGPDRAAGGDRDPRDDDWDSLEVRIHEVEHRLLPRAVRALLEDRLVVDGRIVEIRGGRA